MKSPLTRLVVGAAVVSMAVAPIAAQANTRAGDHATAYSVKRPAIPVVVDDDDDDDEGGWLRGILIGVLLLGAIGGMVIVIGDGDNQSPGAN